MPAATIMIQGTASDVGKSIITAGVCRLLARRGLRVAPFKAQNMSLNAAAITGGGEIGRAQALQALAAGIDPHVDMNPILLKPQHDTEAQVIVLGAPQGSRSARDYHHDKAGYTDVVGAALGRLRAAYDVVVIEGAGSPVELNLKDRDLANMFVAELADAPVLLVADIDRGGIFASVCGTLALLEPHERARVAGIIVNRFRGDPALFEDGVRLLEEKTGVPVLGVVPYLHDLYLPEEDGQSLPLQTGRDKDVQCHIGVVRTPRMANFDDFMPLAATPGVALTYIDQPADLVAQDAIILPGSKATTRDLQWLRGRGMAGAIRDYAAKGGHVLGVCGGYQMLGQFIEDDVESHSGRVDGLGLLPVSTVFAAEKMTGPLQFRVTGSAWFEDTDDVYSGYEIHHGQVTPDTAGSSPLKITSSAELRPEGAETENIFGTLIHGFFNNDVLRRQFLKRVAPQMHVEDAGHDVKLQTALNRVADTLAEHIGTDRILQCMGQATV